MGVRSTKRCSHALDDKVVGKLCNISAVCQTNHVSQRDTNIAASAEHQSTYGMRSIKTAVAEVASCSSSMSQRRTIMTTARPVMTATVIVSQLCGARRMCLMSTRGRHQV